MSEVLLTSQKFVVERREFIVPGRGAITREIVTHPGAVIILPVLDDKHIVMIHNYRYTVGAELTELPAGTLEPPEKPIVCAKRELEEETGYVAGRIEPMGTFYTTPGFTNELMYCFVAHDLTKMQQKLVDGEQIRVEVVTMNQAVDWIRKGKIVDGKTIATLMRYMYDRRQG